MHSEPTPNSGQAAIWVHAEAFGYGPSALALTILPKLRDLVAVSGSFPSIEYIGTGHSLDLNTSPPWDNVHDCDVFTPDGKKNLEHLIHIHRPSLIISIVDEEFIGLVSQIDSTKLIIIDQLFWLWPEIPQTWRSAKQVIAVEYMGVRERIQKESMHNAVIVPPQLPPIGETVTIGERKGTLINLGGLQNPYVPVAENVAYAKLILRLVTKALERRNDPSDYPLWCLASQQVRLGMDSDTVSSKTPGEARALLAQCRTAFLTSGRTNTYDAADCGGRVIFLPPTNQTQGMQPDLLKEKLGCSVHRIDWVDFNPSLGAVDYGPTGEQDSFALIRQHQQALVESEEAQERLLGLIHDSFEIAPDNSNSLQKIFERFGRDNGSLVAKAVAQANVGFGIP